jgi:glycerol uptake facilitator-like aquaporin
MFLFFLVVSPAILFTYVLEASPGITVVANAISVAFVLCVLIEVFGPISGAHFNPVVTLAMLLDKKIAKGKAALFLLVQTLGGITATALTHIMFWCEERTLFSVSETVRGYAFLGEVIGTFILILAILLLVKGKSAQMPMMVGFLVGGQLMATSSTMFANPQVTIARMLTCSAPGIRPMDGLIFIVMQVIGALLAYAVYKFAFSKVQINEEKN